VDDSVDNQNAILVELRTAGFEPRARTVSSEADYLAALDYKLDVILCAYRLPHFDGMRALALLKTREMDVPLIMLSAAFGDESIIDLMREGAADCLLKARLTQLGPAISLAIDQRQRRAREACALEELCRLAEIVASSDDAMISRTLQGTIVSWNGGAQRMFGYTAAEAIGNDISMIIPLAQRNQVQSDFAGLQLGHSIRHFETTRRHKDGTELPVSVSAAPIMNSTGEITSVAVVLRDVSELKTAHDILQRKTLITQLLVAAASKTSASVNAEEALQACLALLCAHGNWMLGHVVTFRSQTPGRPLHSLWESADRARFEKFIAAAEQLDYSTATGQFIGRAIATKQAVWIEDFSAIERAEILQTHGIRCGLVMPVVTHGEIVALIELFARESRAPDRLLLEAAPNLLEQLARVVERQRAFDTQREHEEKLDGILGSLQEVVWSMDLQSGRILYINAAVQSITGRSISDLVRHSRLWRRMVHPNDRKHIRSEVQSLLRDGARVQRFRIVHADGDVRTVSCSARVRLDETGKAVRIDGTVGDVTEQMRAEKLYRRRYQLSQLQVALSSAVNQAVKPEEALQSSLALISGHGDWLVGHLTTFATSHGQRKLVTSLWQVGDRARFAALIEHSEASDGSNCGRFMHQVMSETAPVWIEDIGTILPGMRAELAMAAGLRSAFAFPVVVQNELAAVLQFYAEDVRQIDLLLIENIVNVTAKLARVIERSRANEIQAQLAAIVASSQDAIVSSTPDGTINTWNTGAEKMFGYASAEIIGRKIAMLVPDELSREVWQRRQCYLSGGNLEPYESERLTKDKRRLTVSASLSTLKDANGQIIGFATIYRDVTDQKLAEAALRQLNDELEDKVGTRTVTLNRARREAEDANRAKSMFLAAMSHEIRTPMNGVIGMIDVLHQTSLRGEQVEMVDLIRESAFSLLGIINDILDFSKIEAGKLEIEREPFALIDVVEGVGGLLNSMAEKKGVILTLFVDPAIPAQVEGDALRLRQVLTNLINNAIKFSSGQSRAGFVSARALLISHKSEQLTVEFQVSDNGIGIDEETQTRLFTAFTQADASTTRRFGGTGLGLTISNYLVELMGGKITVLTVPGEGATFVVRLPFIQRPTDLHRSQTASAFTGLSCVVVGDQGALVDDLAAYLKHENAIVDRVPNLASAAVRAAGYSDRSVWVVDAGDDPQMAVQTLESACANIDQNLCLSVVFIGRGKRRRPRALQAHLITVDGNCLTRRHFLNAVAASVGRASLEPEAEFIASRKVAPITPSREQALRCGRLILIAEDNETNQKVILRQLALLGHIADVAADGREALDRWRSGEYAMLLTDLHMPKMDGYALTKAIRAEEKSGNRIPIAALTANALKGEADHCRATGMDDYQSKPIQLADLKAMLDKWLTFDDPAPVAPALSKSFIHSIPQAATGMPVDVNVLKALVGDDRDVVREFFQDFRNSAAKITMELRDAAAAKQVMAVVAAAHKLKSAARAVGACALGELCEAIEEKGRVGDSDALTALLPRFDSERELVEDYLDRW
jgi:PAS domain S-box-containing protein